jgi:hypothetical protein
MSKRELGVLEETFMEAVWNNDGGTIDLERAADIVRSMCVNVDRILYHSERFDNPPVAEVMRKFLVALADHIKA